MGLVAKISAGTLQNSSTSPLGYIVLGNKNIKDAFNHIETQPLSPGKYKVRIRRTSDDVIELSSGSLIFSTMTRDTCYVKNSTSLSNTGTNIVIYQGKDKLLTPTTDVILGNGKYRITNITYTNCIVTGSPIYSDALVLPELTSLSGSNATRKVTLEVKSHEGANSTVELIQSILTTGLSSEYEIQATGNEFRQFDTANAGLFQLKKDGVNIPITETVYYTLQEANSSEPSTTSATTGQINVTDQLINNIDKYTIRAYLNSDKTSPIAKKTFYLTYNAEDHQNYRRYSKAVLYAINAFSPDEAFIPPKWKNLTGDKTDVLIARTAIMLESSSKINGRIDGINGIVTTMCLDYNTDAKNWVTRPTNNPASLFLHVLTHPANAYRVTNDSSIAESINIPNLAQWHDYCRINGFTYNDIVDRTRSIIDVLKDIAAAGRASPSLIDGKWGVVIDRPRTAIIQHFTPHNSWGFEGIRAIPRQPDALRATIRDEEQGYQEAEVVIFNEGLNSSTSEIYEEISLPGVTNKAQARNHLRWHLAQTKYRPNRYTLNCDMEYLVCTRGDRVKVVHDVPNWGSGSARVKSISSNTITLDDEIPYFTGGSYVARIRLNTGQAIVVPITITNSNTITTTGNISGVNTGDLILIGTNDSEIKDLVVLSIEPTEGRNARLTLTDYAEEIYSANLSALYPVEQSTTVILPPGELTDSIETAPEVYSIVSDLSVATVTGNNSWIYNIVVNLSYNTGTPTNVSGYEIQALKYPEEDFSVGTTKIYNVGERLVIPDTVPDTEYRIRIRYVGMDGRVGPWSIDPITDLAYYTHTTSSPAANYDVPNYISVDLDHTYLKIAVNVESTKSANFQHYEFRILKDPDSLVTEDFWDYADDENNPYYNDIVKVTSISEFAEVDLRNFSSPRFDPDGIMYRIACRSVNTDGTTNNNSTLYGFLLVPLTIA